MFLKYSVDCLGWNGQNGLKNVEIGGLSRDEVSIHNQSLLSKQIDNENLLLCKIIH